VSTEPLVIRPICTEDLSRVLEFRRTHYSTSPDKGDPQQFDWQFAQHPLGSSLDGYMLAWQGETLIGQLATMRDRLLVDGTWQEVRWLCDLMVAPAERGGLVALRLFQAAMKRNELLLATGAGSAMEPLYRSLGWRQMQIAKSYYLPIHPRALLRLAKATGREEEANLDLKSLVAAVAGGVLLRVLPGVVRKQQLHAQGVICEKLSTINGGVDVFLAQVAPKLGITPWRSADVYRWKFAAGPESDLQAWFARDRGTSAIRGVLVARLVERPDLARWLEIVDYVAIPEDRTAFMALLCAAMDAGLTQKLDFLRMRLSRPEHVKLLPSPWWREYTLPVTDDVFAWSEDATMLEKLNTQLWHLTSLVSDRA
jgi:hypothetical protein